MLPRLAVFDCDGTLVDTEAGIVQAMKQAFTSEQLLAPEPDRIRHVVGLSLLESVKELAPNTDPSRQQRMVESYREAYSELRRSPGFQQQLFPGTLEVLDELGKRGVLLGIATGKSRKGLETTLELHGIRELFATLQTADDAPSKPHPGMVLQAMQETGSEAGETIFLGDTVYDMQAAQHAEATAVGVAWGYHPREELHRAGAMLVIDDYSELLDWMDGD